MAVGYSVEDRSTLLGIVLKWRSCSSGLEQGGECFDVVAGPGDGLPECRGACRAVFEKVVMNRWLGLM
jgi:hypothetical protein